MIEGNKADGRKEKIMELIMLFSSLSSHKREIILEIARIMYESKKE